MTSKMWGNVLVLIAVVGLLAGCRTAPIYNVTDATVASPEGKSLTSDDVKKAIMAAGAGLGWDMKPTEPGHIVGTLHIRSHAAVVDIPYSEKSYSILYKSSSNLKYDASDGSIHSNYNGWIQNLDNAIKAKLATL